MLRTSARLNGALEIIVMHKRIRRRRSKRLLPYAEHWHTADVLDTNSKENPKGAYHLRLAGVLFRYFALESFLNLIGEEQFKCWKDLERLSTEKKLNLLAEKTGITPDYARMPWQMLRKLTDIRNQIAHGKNIPLEKEDVISAEKYDREMFSSLKAEWQEFPTPAACAQVKRHVKAVMAELWMASGHELSTLFTRGFQFESAEIESEE